jgi:hypothetical protein
MDFHNRTGVTGMASILYIPAENGLEQCFRALLDITVPDKEFEVCRTIRELTERLGRPLSNVKVAVLFAINREGIEGILSIGDLMQDAKTILILADQDKDTIMKAHTLRPRYIASLDIDFDNVPTVLKRMVDLYDNVT